MTSIEIEIDSSEADKMIESSKTDRSVYASWCGSKGNRHLRIFVELVLLKLDALIIRLVMLWLTLLD